MSELSWADIHASGNTVVSIVVKALKGEATIDEEFFVMTKVSPEILLSVALMNGLKLHV